MTCEELAVLQKRLDVPGGGVILPSELAAGKKHYRSCKACHEAAQKRLVERKIPPLSPERIAELDAIVARHYATDPEAPK
jgi:cytochrome c553